MKTQVYAIEKLTGVGPATDPSIVPAPSELLNIGALEGLLRVVNYQQANGSTSSLSLSNITLVYPNGLGVAYSAPSFYDYRIADFYGYVTGLPASSRLVAPYLGLYSTSPTSLSVLGYSSGTVSVSQVSDSNSTLPAGTYRVHAFNFFRLGVGYTFFRTDSSSAITISSGVSLEVQASNNSYIRYYLSRQGDPNLYFVGSVWGNIGMQTLRFSSLSKPEVPIVYAENEHSVFPNYPYGRARVHKGRMFIPGGRRFFFSTNTSTAELSIQTSGAGDESILYFTDVGYSNFGIDTANFISPTSFIQGLDTGFYTLASTDNYLYLATASKTVVVQSDFTSLGSFAIVQPSLPVGTFAPPIPLGEAVYVANSKGLYRLVGAQIADYYPYPMTYGDSVRYGPVGGGGAVLVALGRTSSGPTQYYVFDVLSEAWTGGQTVPCPVASTIPTLNTLPYMDGSTARMISFSSIVTLPSSSVVQYSNISCGLPHQRKSFQWVQIFGENISSISLTANVDGQTTTVSGTQRGDGSWYFRLPGHVGQLISLRFTITWSTIYNTSSGDTTYIRPPILVGYVPLPSSFKY